jgi:hypothetical protein
MLAVAVAVVHRILAVAVAAAVAVAHRILAVAAAGRHTWVAEAVARTSTQHRTSMQPRISARRRISAAFSILPLRG